MKKKYIYKAYRDGVYVGNLPRPINEFEYDQAINSAGAFITIELPVTLEGINAQLTDEYLVDEDGETIVNELGEEIIVSQEYNFDAPIDVNTRIDVWLSYENAVNGRCVFSGLIESFEERSQEGKIVLQVISNGAQLDNYMITSGDSPYLIQDASNTIGSLYKTGLSASPLIQEIIQTVTISTVAELSGVGFQLQSGSGTIQVDMYRMLGGTPDIDLDTLVATGSITIDAVIQDYEYVAAFSEPLTTVAGATYAIVWRMTTHSKTAFLKISSANPYAGGQIYTATKNITFYLDYDYHYTSFSAYDVLFTLYQNTGGLIAPYTGFAPSAMLRDIMDSYVAQGGLIAYTTASIEDTPNSETHTFRFNTLLEGIKKCYELAGAGWYWYVDVGTNTLYFRQIGSEADHTLYVGKHIERFDVKRTLEGIKTKVLFTGGDDGSGSNVLVNAEDAESKALYGQWLDKPADNRVTLTATAERIANGILFDKKEPRWQTTVSVIDKNYDIETFELGQIVTFANAGSFKDSLALQIVGIKKRPHIATLTLDTLARDTVARLEEARSSINNILTNNNPDTY